MPAAILRTGAHEIATAFFMFFRTEFLCGSEQGILVHAEGCKFGFYWGLLSLQPTPDSL